VVLFENIFGLHAGDFLSHVFLSLLFFLFSKRIHLFLVRFSHVSFHSGLTWQREWPNEISMSSAMSLSSEKEEVEREETEGEKVRRAKAHHPFLLSAFKK
jgi:hypothetical protein